MRIGEKRVKKGVSFDTKNGIVCAYYHNGVFVVSQAHCVKMFKTYRALRAYLSAIL